MKFQVPLIFHFQYSIFHQCFPVYLKGWKEMFMADSSFLKVIVFQNKIPLNMKLFTLKMKLEFFRSAFKIFTQSNTFFTKKYENGDDKSEMSSLEKFHTKTTNKKLHT